MNDDIDRGDALIKQALATGDPDGGVSQALIREFYSNDYPVEKVIPLLRSDDDEVVKTGAFIAEELAGRARRLMPEVMRLLDHRDRWVKAPMINVVLTAATPSDAAVIARASAVIDDPDPAMRRVALNFLARIDDERLAAGLPEVLDGRISDGLGWRLGDDEAREFAESRLTSLERVETRKRSSGRGGRRWLDK